MEEGYGEESDAANAALQPVNTPIIDAEIAVTPRQILVIEDNEINRKVLQSLLQKDSHIVHLAGSGEQGLDMLKEQSVDVLFVDINLPGISGTEVTRHIRRMNEPALRALPIVALTGNVMPDDVKAIKESGVDEVMSKPIDYDKIRTFLHNLDDKRVDTSTAGAPLSSAPEESMAADDTSANETVSKAPPSDDIDQTAYDFSILQGLLHTLGADTLNELLDGCFDKVDEIMDALSASNNQSNADFIYARMHELKGMCYNFGLKEIGDLAAAGEKLAKNNDIEAAHEKIAKLRAVKKSAKDGLRSWADSQ